MAVSQEKNCIDWLRAICALLVVALHAYVSPLSTDSNFASWDSGAYDFARIAISRGICQIAVPTFFLISGYLFYVGLREWDWQNWTHKIRRRATSLLLPFVLWGIIATLTTLTVEWSRGGLQNLTDVQEWIAKHGGIRILWDCGRLGGMPLDYPLWFIRDLMILCLVAPAIHWLTARLGWAWIAICAALYVSSTQMAYCFCQSVGILFFSVGCKLQLDATTITEWTRKRATICAICATIIFPFVIISFGHIGYSFINRTFCLFGVIAIVGLVNFFFNSHPVRLPHWFGRSIFFVYAMHGVFALSMVQKIILLSLPNSDWARLTAYLASPILTVCLLVIIANIVWESLPNVARLLSGGRSYQHINRPCQ